MDISKNHWRSTGGEANSFSMVWMQGCLIQVILLQSKWVGIAINSLEEKAEGLYF